tara:strand:+ start:178 stop:438 length:261 start_codon:yes stop_codon:yes gene_type:complete
MTKTKRHNWSWDFTSLAQCDAYCLDCGMLRTQLDNYDTNFVKVTKYYKDNTRVKKAGQCKFNPTDSESNTIQRIQLKLAQRLQKNQ